MKEDADVRKLRKEVVPAKLEDEEFWVRYFYCFDIVIRHFVEDSKLSAPAFSILSADLALSDQTSNKVETSATKVGKFEEDGEDIDIEVILDSEDT